MRQFKDVCLDEYQGVLKFLTRLCGNAQLAEEMTQETFYQAAKGWRSFHGQCSAYTWLCAIAKRVYWSSLRKPTPPLAAADPELPCPDFTDLLVRRDQAIDAYHLLHSLPEPYREVFTMRTFCELTHAQIGDLFGKSESWARVTYYRARVLLQQAMKED